MRWHVLACGIAATILSGCGLIGGSTPVDGAVNVTVTLSRSGGLGPTLNNVPQSGVHVTVTDDSGGRWSGTTDGAGEANVAVPSPGEYDVDISFCPDAPQQANLAEGATAKVRFDCLAP